MGGWAGTHETRGDPRTVPQELSRFLTSQKERSSLCWNCRDMFPNNVAVLVTDSSAVPWSQEEPSLALSPMPADWHFAYSRWSESVGVTDFARLCYVVGLAVFFQ